MTLTLFPAIFVVYIAILAIYGFFVKRPNWLGWFMFTRGSFCYAELFCNGERVNIWDYLPHCQVIVHKPLLFQLITYLRDEKRMTNLNGMVKLYTDKGVLEFKVQDGYVLG